VKRLQKEFALTTFVTLSPIPGFTQWLRRRLDREAGSAYDRVAADADALRLALAGDAWLLDPGAEAQVKPKLLRLCAHYLLREKRRCGKGVRRERGSQFLA
jgi:malonyl-CoA decarboxylase